jgi:2-polyprenyl-3-methyl-5-hydroxy-6-metoxy-1,4-benzoquinol methylase
MKIGKRKNLPDLPDLPVKISLISLPVRVVAKQGRHAAMRVRRATKLVRQWSGWEALAGQPRRLADLAVRVKLPVHRLATERRTCPACESSSIEMLEPLGLYETVEKSRVGFAAGCHACGLLFVNPPPDLHSLQSFYSPEGTWGVTHATERRELLERQAQRALEGYRKPNAKRRSRDFVLDALQRYVPVFDPPAGAAVLDFGCGDGKLLNVLLEIGWATHGIEPSSDVAFLRHTRLDRIPDTPSFDLVLLHHVLEHLPDPFAVMRDLAVAMRPGGVMFISVPRLDTLPRHGDFRYCLNARTHLVSFSEACLRELLARAGLETAGVLDDPMLDAKLTDGVPLRLRLVARKAGAHPPRVERPLVPALDALARYHAKYTPTEHWFERLLPVRTRAFLLDREQRRKGTHRATAA